MVDKEARYMIYDMIQQKRYNHINDINFNKTIQYDSIYDMCFGDMYII